MYKLIIEDDEGKTTVVPLIRDEITIGRKEGNTIRLTERNVSRRHARLSKANGTVYIEDLESYNGIRVNGDRIAGRAPITEGDRIQIGDYQLALKVDKTAPSEPTEDDGGETRTTPFVREDLRGTSPGATAAPDVPTRAQPVVATAAEPPPDRPARIVVVSSNFAGREFRLDQPQSVIGRTDENDVVINHRSISRHHAKIVRENGRHQIVDLGSANGVRVNGEDYGKVELRKGDLIDLGHVRMRFVAPNEDFVFARDAQVVDVGGSGRRSPLLLLAVGAVLLLLVGVGAAVVVRGGGSGGGAPGGGDSARVAEATLDVDRALGALDWDGAISHASTGLALDPNSGALREKKSKAEAERKALAIYRQYSDAARAGDHDLAVIRYLELPDSSVYHEKAQETWPVIQGAYVNRHLQKARDLQSSGHCDEAKKHVESIILVDETNAAAIEIANRCGQPTPTPRKPAGAAGPGGPGTPRPAAVARPERPDRPDRPEHTERPAPAPARGAGASAAASPGAGPGAAAARPEPAGNEPSETVKPSPAPAGGGSALAEAQDCYVHADYQCALEKARKELKSDPGNTKAWRLIGASNCFLKDKAGASLAWSKLTTQERSFLRYVCNLNKITLP